VHRIAEIPARPNRLVVAGNPHGAKKLLCDVDLALTMHPLVFPVADNVALGLCAGDHFFHVAPANLLQRLAAENVDMPGLGVHRRGRTLGDVEDLLDDLARHRLFAESPHAAPGLHQFLEIHVCAPALVPFAALLACSPPPVTGLTGRLWIHCLINLPPFTRNPLNF